MTISNSSHGPFVDIAAVMAAIMGLVKEIFDTTDEALIWQMKTATSYAYHALAIMSTSTIGAAGNSLHKVEHSISKSSDFVDNMWLSIEIPELTVVATRWAAYVPYLAHALCSSVEVTVSGVSAHTLTTFVLNAHYQYSVTASKRAAYNEMIGNTTEWTNIVSGDAPAVADTKMKSGTLYLPLPFFFNPDGKSLPLVMIPYNDIKVVLTRRSLLDVSYIS